MDAELELDEVKAEWQSGVFNADSPADNAICNNGCDGKESSSW